MAPGQYRDGFRRRIPLFLTVVGGIVAIACAYLYFDGKFPFWEALQHGYFQSVMIVTGNGLTTAGYSADWPVSCRCCCCWVVFGGCVGSTCGGIKAIRFLLLYRPKFARGPAADPAHRANRGQGG